MADPGKGGHDAVGTTDPRATHDAAPGVADTGGRTAGGSPASRSTTRIEISTGTFVRAILTILATLLLIRVARAASGLLVLLAMSFFFSLALDPAVRSLHRRFGWRRGAAVGVIYAGHRVRGVHDRRADPGDRPAGHPDLDEFRRLAAAVA
ncbi:hypothetical protein [Salsipaludibacter albus]|uniref:hypothetical protein n=1 Tax=Salsipaludibacter albus TaxID=2849650 RepID=UPI001EE3A913|nr:hypothetical protein [Salsipaludibacter albus]MBY5162512.1 hypothetical protein [Salsipaludibacter albus]